MQANRLVNLFLFITMALNILETCLHLDTLLFFSFSSTGFVPQLFQKFNWLYNTNVLANFKVTPSCPYVFTQQQQQQQQ